MNLEGLEPDKFDKNKLAITDKWILSRLAQTIDDVTDSLEKFRFSEPLTQLYKFFWNDLCDWFLEWAKPRMQDPQQKPIAQNVLAFVLDQTLRLLHPFIPFITEGIFQKLNEIAPNRGLKGLAEIRKCDVLTVAEWPKKIDSLINTGIEKQIETIQSVIKAIRDIRSKYNKAPSEKLIASGSSSGDTMSVLNENAGLVCQLAGLKKFTASQSAEKLKNAAAAIVDDIQVYVHDVVDLEAEQARLEKQKQQIENARKTIEAKLNNENFISRAKPEVVSQTKQKLNELTEQLETITKHLSQSGG
jgi:valyl-tRNA synthetase